jgi:transcriptional regulator with XRE-family HTH domain
VTVYDVAAMKAARIAAGLTQSALARAAGWAPNQLCEIESGARPMTEASAERYWRALREATAAKEVERV